MQASRRALNLAADTPSQITDAPRRRCAAPSLASALDRGALCPRSREVLFLWRPCQRRGESHRAAAGWHDGDGAVLMCPPGGAVPVRLAKRTPYFSWEAWRRDRLALMLDDCEFCEGAMMSRSYMCVTYLRLLFP